MKPLVSVVIPTLNRPEPLSEALASVHAQRNVPGTVEVIVVNDGGRDIGSVIANARTCGLQVTLINLSDNQGLPTARNVGIDAAGGEFLALLDDDDVFLPNHLATLLDAVDHESADAAYGMCMVSTTRVDPANGYPDGAESWSSPFDADLLAVANYIPVHSALVRMPPWSARFDPRLVALEDWDMWLRLVREHEYRFHHVAVPTVVYHRIPADDSMCGATVNHGAALAGFGDLVQRVWTRWPAQSTTTRRYRLYIALMYWHALATLAKGERLADNYFLRCAGHIAAAWHGDQPECDLPGRIIESIKDTTHASVAA